MKDICKDGDKICSGLNAVIITKENIKMLIDEFNLLKTIPKKTIEHIIKLLKAEIGAPEIKI
jgi:hypothetical protein